MVVLRRRSHQRQVDIELVEARTSHLCSAISHTPPSEGPRFALAGGLDPAAGDLNEARAARKRAQVSSTAAHALALMRAGDHVVEFGAGSGHLGLLLADVRRDCSVTLVEIKEWTCAFARERVSALGLTNCTVFCGSVDGFAASGATFDLAVGLHCCGLLTDSVLELALSQRASVCMVPCCYGQIVSTEDHQRGGTTAPNMHPRSTAFREVLGGDGLAAFRAVAKAADFNVVKDGGAFDVDSDAFATAVRCMRLVDTDRLLWMREGSSPGREHIGIPYISLSRLSPPTCSPKCSIMLVDYRASTPPPVLTADHACAQGVSAVDADGAGKPAEGACGHGMRQDAWLALFGGQGAVGGQMREMRRVASDPSVRQLLADIAASLQQQLARWEATPHCVHASTTDAAAHALSYAHGLHVHAWARSRDTAPPRSYLELVHVSIPLIFAAQVCPLPSLCCAMHMHTHAGIRVCVCVCTYRVDVCTHARPYAHARSHAYTQQYASPHIPPPLCSIPWPHPTDCHLRIFSPSRPGKQRTQLPHPTPLPPLAPHILFYPSLTSRPRRHARE